MSAHWTVSSEVARVLTLALMRTIWQAEAVQTTLETFFSPRGSKRALGRLKSALFSLAKHYAPPPRKLRKLLLASEDFHTLVEKRGNKALPGKFALTEMEFRPIPRFANLEIPKIAAVQDLADWLGLTSGELDWFSDNRDINRNVSSPALQHYSYHLIAKASGKPRLIEAPKDRLLAIQRLILRTILDKVPPHPAAFGFVMGRNCIQAAAKHAGEHVVIKLDLKDFFPSVPIGRVYGLFRSLGYPHEIAVLLTRLCSTTTPRSVLQSFSAETSKALNIERNFALPHLAQGAPTSPALANLVAFRLDARLSGLAKCFDATYTQYADDMSFSGDAAFSRRASGFLKTVEAIVKDEYFSPNLEKTRISFKSDRQVVTGVVVNDHVNFERRSFDALKAILYNCRKNGPAAENRAAHQDFRAHLNGRITWIEQINMPRGAKLRRIFNEIAW